MIRKSLFFVVTVLIVGWAGYQLAWHPELVGGAGEIGKSVLAIVAALIAVPVVIWAVAKPTAGKVILAFVLGIIAALLGDSLWAAIGFGQLGWLAISLIVLSVLYAGTVFDRRSRSANDSPTETIRLDNDTSLKSRINTVRQKMADWASPN